MGTQEEPSQVKKPEGLHIEIVEAQRNIAMTLNKVEPERQDLYIEWVNASLEAKEPVLEEDYSDIEFERDQNAFTAKHIPTQLHTDFTCGRKKGKEDIPSGHVLPGKGAEDYREAGQTRLNRHLKKHLQYWNTVLDKHGEKVVTKASISKVLNLVT